MSSGSFICIGSGSVLGYLRSDLRKAKDTLSIVGPWLDDYFAAEVVKVAPSRLDVTAIVRPEDQMAPEAWNRTLAALSAFSSHWTEFEARSLDKLHAKVLCIDGSIAYVGSANWYKYSLEKTCEIVLRGPLEEINGLDAELESLWKKGNRLELQGLSDKKRRYAPKGIDHEVVDPLAADVLRRHPDAWILRKKD